MYWINFSNFFLSTQNYHEITHYLHLIGEKIKTDGLIFIHLEDSGPKIQTQVPGLRAYAHNHHQSEPQNETEIGINIGLYLKDKLLESIFYGL